MATIPQQLRAALRAADTAALRGAARGVEAVAALRADSGSCGAPGHVHGPGCRHFFTKGTSQHSGNRGVVYAGPGRVEVQDLPPVKLELNHPGNTRKCEHGVILRVVATNICGSDQHSAWRGGREQVVLVWSCCRRRE
jgi:hypothetical protein